MRRYYRKHVVRSRVHHVVITDEKKHGTEELFLARFFVVFVVLILLPSNESDVITSTVFVV